MNAYLSSLTALRQKYRAFSFILAYAAVFFVLALCGYYASTHVAIVDHVAVLKPSKRTFHSDMVYYPLPRMNISMSTSGGDGGGGESAPRLRVQIMLEVADKDAEILAGFEPRISEKINTYMLKLKPEELTRENSVTWLRAELLRQVNSVGAPVPIHDIYFQQFVVM